MFVLEYKVKPKPNQIEAINEAIRTTQFVRNKVLRYWMDNRGVSKTELFRYNTALRKEFKFVDDLNSHACQTAVERTSRKATLSTRQSIAWQLPHVPLDREEGDVIAY